MEGKKEDKGKLRYDLIPPNALMEVAGVLTHGAQKYGAENWRKVPNCRRRYYSAVMRHLEAWRLGEEIDESGYAHIAHAITSLMFILEKESLGIPDSYSETNVADDISIPTPMEEP